MKNVWPARRRYDLARGLVYEDRAAKDVRALLLALLSTALLLAPAHAGHAGSYERNDSVSGSAAPPFVTTSDGYAFPARAGQTVVATLTPTSDPLTTSGQLVVEVPCLRSEADCTVERQLCQSPGARGPPGSEPSRIVLTVPSDGNVLVKVSSMTPQTRFEYRLSLSLDGQAPEGLWNMEATVLNYAGYCDLL